MRPRSVRGDALLSLEEDHPSMGKMAGANVNRSGRSGRLSLQSGLEPRQLHVGKSMEKRLEEHNGLAQAGIEIVMNRVQHLPIKFRLQGLAAGEFFHGVVETAIQSFDKVGEHRDFVKELGFAGKQDFAEKIIEARDALTSRILKILRRERGEIGSGAKVLGVLEHGVQYGEQRVGQSLTKRGRNGENLIGFESVPTAAHAEGFIQSYAKHGIGSLKTPDGGQIRVSLITTERKSPI
jgi:hypothetical protein